MKLILNYPVRPIYINQSFGSPSPVYTNEGLKGHNGIDFMASHGQPIYASHDGQATFQIDSGGGHGVVLVTNEKFDYLDTQAYFKTIYWHMCDGLKEPQFMSPIADKSGFVPIKEGDLLGYADSTGLSTGDHLHFGLKPVQPGENPGNWSNVSQTNGYFGAIDPQPYLIDLEVIEKEISTAQQAVKVIATAPVANSQKLIWLESIKELIQKIFS